MNRIKSPLNEEEKIWQQEHRFVIGLDEAGRGAIAGPVFSAAVMLKSQDFKIFSQIFKIMEINNRSLRGFKIKDSKKLTPQKREKIFKIIISHPYIEYSISSISEKVIDNINIKNAAELAMLRCILKLDIKSPFLIIDGNHINSKKLKKMSHKLIVKADENVFSCALASIVAKVSRDKVMEKLAKKNPKYFFEKNKGYPTKQHLRLLEKYGPCSVHRKSFLPIKNQCIFGD